MESDSFFLPFLGKDKQIKKSWFMLRLMATLCRGQINYFERKNKKFKIKFINYRFLISSTNLII